MSKKSIVYFIMLAVTPYLAVIPLLLTFVGSDELWQVFGNNAYNLFIHVALFIILTGILTAVCFVLSLKNKWDAYALVKTMAIIKLIHIPAYIAIFIVGAFCALTVFSLPFTILLAVFDYLLLVMSGLMTSSAVILAVNQNPQLSKKYYLLIIFQFVYCVDVVATWIFYLNLKKEKGKIDNYIHNTENL